MKEIIRQKSLGCGFNFETFTDKNACANFLQNSHAPTRWFTTRKPMDRRGPSCADMGTMTRARGEGRARPPLRQHPTPPRRRRRPRPHSRYQRGACRGALGRCVMGTCCTAYGLSRGARARRRGAHVSYSGRSAGFDHRRGITGG